MAAQRDNVISITLRQVSYVAFLNQIRYFSINNNNHNKYNPIRPKLGVYLFVLIYQHVKFLEFVAFFH